MRYTFNVLGLLVGALRALFPIRTSVASAEEATPFPIRTSVASAEEDIAHYSLEYCSMVDRYYKGLKWNDVPDEKKSFIQREMKKCNDVRAVY